MKSLQQLRVLYYFFKGKIVMKKISQIFLLSEHYIKFDILMSTVKLFYHFRYDHDFVWSMNMNLRMEKNNWDSSLTLLDRLFHFICLYRS